MASKASSQRRPAPDHLTDQAQKWWSSVLTDYALDAHHVHIPTLAAEALDRCNQARVAIAEHGAIYTDRWGQPKARPEVAIERDCRIAFARLVRELDLDGEPLPEPRLPRRT